MQLEEDLFAKFAQSDPEIMEKIMKMSNNPHDFGCVQKNMADYCRMIANKILSSKEKTNRDYGEFISLLMALGFEQTAEEIMKIELPIDSNINYCHYFSRIISGNMQKKIQEEVVKKINGDFEKSLIVEEIESIEKI